MKVDLAEIAAPQHTAIVTQECQGAVVGPNAGLAVLAEEARREAVPNIERLLPAARDAGVKVVHCLVQRRPDGVGGNPNAKICAIGSGVVIAPGPQFVFTATITLVGGTMFLMWLGEQITARGVGNGVSLIIFAGIVAALPGALIQTLELGRTGALSALFIIALVIGVVVVVAVVVFMETAQRRIVVQYPKRQVGNRMYGGEASHLPLKINTSGVIPPIFASSLLLFPATIASFQGAAGEPGWVQWIATYLGHGQPLYLLSYVGLIVFFCFFYTTVVFNPVDTADNLKKNGGFVPGIRPGKNTAEYLEYILNRLTVIGALYLSAVCILPELLIARGGVPFYFGGTSLLIVVSVTLDTVTQIQAHLLAHQYEGLIKKARLRGRAR